MNFLGNLLRQQLCYPSKLHGKGHHRTMPNLSGWRRRGWEAAFCAGWGLGDTCETTASSRCHGVGKTNHTSPWMVRFLPEMCLFSRARKPKAEEGINQKNCTWEVWLQCSDLPPLWAQTDLGGDKTSKELPSNLFLILSANLPQQNINLSWETSFK